MQLSMFDTVTLHKVKKNTTSKRIKSFDSPPYAYYVQRYGLYAILGRPVCRRFLSTAYV